MYMGSVYVNVMIFVFLYMIFALVATAKRMREERRNSNYFKEHPKYTEHVLCSF